MKKHNYLLKRLTAALLFVIMAFSIASVTTITSFAAGSDANEKAAQAGEEVAGEVIELIPNEGVKFVLKSALDIFKIYTEKAVPENATEKQLEEVEKNLANQINNLSGQADTNHQELVRALKALDAKSDLFRFYDTNDTMYNTLSNFVVKYNSEQESLKNEKNKTIEACGKDELKEIYSQLLKDTKCSYADSSKELNNDINTFNADTNTKGINMLDMYKNFIIQQQRDKDTQYNFSKAATADEIKKTVNKELSNLEIRTMVYAAFCKTIDDMENTVAGTQVPASHIVEMKSQAGAITDSFKKCFSAMDSYEKKSDAITVSNITKSYNDITEAWRIACNSATQAPTTLTLNKDWTADDANGLCYTANPGAASYSSGYTPDCGLYVPENSNLTIDGNNHKFDMSEKSGTSAITLGKGASLTLKNIKIFGGNNGLVFDNSNGKVNVNISNATIHACLGSGVKYNANGDSMLKIKDSSIEFVKNSGVNIGNGARYEIVNTIFKMNSTKSNGGAINDGYNGSITGCFFQGNHAYGNGGAVSNVFNINNCQFSNNDADGNGGAVYTERGLKTIINESSFLRNSCKGNGGAIFMNGCNWYNTGGVNKDRTQNDFTNVTIKLNHADGVGGGVYCNANQNSIGTGIGGVTSFVQSVDLHPHKNVYIFENTSGSGYIADNLFLNQDGSYFSELMISNDLDFNNSKIGITTAKKGDQEVAHLESKDSTTRGVAKRNLFSDAGKKIYRGKSYINTIFINNKKNG